MIIVFGNTKGGTGKSTLAVHIMVALMHKGWRVISVDLDGGQGTLSRYWENRELFQQSTGKKVPMPVQQVRFSPHDEFSPIEDYLKNLKTQKNYDFMVVDTAGFNSELSRHAHSLADVLVTPMNDSGIDLDLLVNVHPTVNSNQLPLSQYATMVWEQRMNKVKREAGSLEWIIVRNRMHNLSSRNQIQIDQILKALAKRIGFYLAGGMTERIIFRELFSYGLTVLDKESSNSSHISAKKEIFSLMDMILSFKKTVGQS